MAKSLIDRAEFFERVLRVIGELPALVMISGANGDFSINEALARVGTLLSASRLRVLMDESNGRYLRGAYEWNNQKTSDITSPSRFLYDFEQDAPSLKKLLADNRVFFGHSRDMPQDLNHFLSQQGVQSFIVSPIFREDGGRAGVVAMDFCENECKFCEEYAAIIGYLGGILSLALERKSAHILRNKLQTIRSCLAGVETLDSEWSQTPLAGAHLAKPTTLLDAERTIIMETLTHYNGNKLKTAKHLGLTWPSLDRRCKKLGIEVKRR